MRNMTLLNICFLLYQPVALGARARLGVRTRHRLSDRSAEALAAELNEFDQASTLYKSEEQTSTAEGRDSKLDEDMASFLEGQDTIQGKPKWKGCHRLVLSNMPLKQYHFEATLRGYGDAEAHVAVEFGRDRVRPYLQIYVNYIWMILPSPLNYREMMWTPTLKDAKDPLKNLAQTPTVEIELAKEMSHLVYSSSPEELTLTLTNGTILTFTDNKYLPEFIYKDAFDRKMELVNAKHNHFQPQRGLHGNMQAALLAPQVVTPGSAVPGTPAVNPGNTDSPGEPPATAHTVSQAGAYPGLSTVPGMPMTGRMLGAMNQGIDASSKYYEKLASKSDELVTNVEKADYMDRMRSGLNLAQVVWLFPFWGQVLLGPAATASRIHLPKKYKREMKISGNIKMFEKMRCHPFIQTCSWNTLAPKFGSCPAA